jgi:hypothetical protein
LSALPTTGQSKRARTASVTDVSSARISPVLVRLARPLTRDDYILTALSDRSPLQGGHRRRRPSANDQQREAHRTTRTTMMMTSLIRSAAPTSGRSGPSLAHQRRASTAQGAFRRQPARPTPRWTAPSRRSRAESRPLARALLRPRPIPGRRPQLAGRVSPARRGRSRRRRLSRIRARSICKISSCLTAMTATMRSSSPARCVRLDRLCPLSPG